MNNVHFPGENCRMGPPPGVPESECSTITVFRGELSDGKPILVSAWEPTPDEMSRIVKTGRIYLYIWSTGMPPVALDVHHPLGIDDMALWNKYYHDLVTASDDEKGMLVAHILSNSSPATAAKAVQNLTADARKGLDDAIHKTPAPAKQRSMQEVMDGSVKPSPAEGKVVVRTDPTVPPAETPPAGPADSTVASPAPGSTGTVKK